jgi:hypothetical protein
MKVTVNFANAENSQTQGRIEVPKKCPVCTVLVTVNTPGVSLNPSTNELQAVHLCTNEDCRSFFIAYYRNTESNIYEVRKLEPPNLTQPSFPDFVKGISPNFLEIYGQAHEAKERGLDHIAGSGYRKAFEFLIKDYAKSIDSSKSKEIDDAFAGNVVNDFVTDTRVQAVAKRALWIGNDEVHYIRKWVDMNVADLINLIGLTIDWIEIERDSKKYLESMEDKKKGSSTTKS